MNPTGSRAGSWAAVLTLSGNGLGLLRDLVLAAVFGASAATDAFLAAWAVPESASPLLFEGLLLLVGLPYLARAVVAGEAREALARTFWPVVAGLSLLGVVAVVLAPWIVTVTVPGIADPDLATTCVRLAAPTIPLLGLAGYLSAVLRAHDHAVAPAGVFLAYNVGIISTMLLAGPAWGVRAAAAGLSVGAVTMCLLLIPTAVRRTGLPGFRRSSWRFWAGGAAAAVPVLAYLLTRQGQTLVERFAASHLAPGSISQFNFAQKIGQVPGTVAVAFALTGVAAIVRSRATEDIAAAARRTLALLRTCLVIATIGTALLGALAVDAAAGLLERGEFSREDSLATADVLRVYVLGLPAQVIVSVLAVAVAAMGMSRWLPAIAAGLGLLVTAAGCALLTPRMGLSGIAAADALGIWVAAVILLAGIVRPLHGHWPPGTIREFVLTGAASVLAGMVAWLVARYTDALPPLASVVVATVAGVVALLVSAYLLRADDILDMVAPGRRRLVLTGRPEEAPTGEDDPEHSGSRGGR